MKTPDEIKKGLDCCIDWENGCTECPYNCLPHDECVAVMKADNLAYIQQLEARIDTLTAKAVLFDDAIAAGEKMKRERDLAVADMTELMKGSESCAFCKHYVEDGDYCAKPPTSIFSNGMCWEWRGLEED